MEMSHRVKTFFSLSSAFILILVLAACEIERGLTLDKVEPAQAMPGSVVRLIGGGFNDLNQLEVKLGETPVAFAEETAQLVSQGEDDYKGNEIAVRVPAQLPLGSYLFSVKSGEEVATLPFTVGAGGGAIVIDPAAGEDEAPQPSESEDEPVQTATIDPCEWPEEAVDFQATGPIYKSSTYQGDQDTSTTLSWTVNTNCTPSKLIIKSFDGSTSEYSGAKAQNWTKQIPALNQTATFQLILMYKKDNANTVVLEKSLEVPVVVMEEAFDVKVTACNKATSTETKCDHNTNWTPQNNYQDPSDYVVTFSMTNDPTLKLCIRSPHAGVESQARHFDWKNLFIKEAYAISNDLQVIHQKGFIEKGLKHKGNLYVFPGLSYNDPPPSVGTVVGKVECFDSNNMLVSPDGKLLTGQFEFKATASTDIVYYAERDSVKFMEATIPLKVKIIHPSSVLDVKRAIPGVGAKNYDLVLEEDSPVLEFKVKLSDGEQFALVTDATDKLYSEATWTASDANKEKINGQSSAAPPGAAKTATCKIMSSEETSGAKNCKNHGYDEAFIEKVRKVLPKRTVHVFKFAVNEQSETYYYAKAMAFDTKTVALGFGYGDYLQVGTVSEAGLPAPQVKFSGMPEFGAAYHDVDSFCTTAFKNELFKGNLSAMMTGETRGAKSFKITRTGCKSSGIASINDRYGEEGVFDFSYECNYDGMNPGFNVEMVDFLGVKRTETCKFNVKMWPMELKLTGHYDGDSTSDRHDFSIEKIEQPGPDPIKTIEVRRVHNACSGAFLNNPVNVEDSRDFSRTFSVEGKGIDCWQIGVKVGTLEGTKWVKWNTSSKSVKNIGKKWTATGWSSSRGNSETIFFPPKLEFSGDFGSAHCWWETSWGDEELVKGEFNWTYSGRHIKDVSCSCNNGANKVSGTVGNIKAEKENGQTLGYRWTGGTDNEKFWDCSCTATGYGDQGDRSSSWWACCDGDEHDESGQTPCGNKR